jgi:hypothetical protein
MTKKHYQQIVTSFTYYLNAAHQLTWENVTGKNSHDYWQATQDVGALVFTLIADLMATMATDNPRFDQSKFIDALAKNVHCNDCSKSLHALIVNN